MFRLKYFLLRAAINLAIGALTTANATPAAAVENMVGAVNFSQAEAD